MISGAGATALVMVLVRAQSHHRQRLGSASMHAQQAFAHHTTKPCHVVQRGSRRTTRALSKQLEPVLLQTHARTRVCTYIVTKHTLAHCHVYLLVRLRSNARWHDQRKQLQHSGDSYETKEHMRISTRNSMFSREAKRHVPLDLV